jgi:hypothetical protein
MTNIQQLIDSLNQDFETYRNICAFKLKTIKNPTFPELKKCSACNGYSSVIECYEFIDIPHLIKFYEDNKR